MGSRPLRRLDQPRSVRVVVGPSGLPHAVELNGVRRHVIVIRDEWLVQDRWWTDEPVDRQYFELVIEPGRVLVVFLDTRSRQWFAHTPAPAAQRPSPPRTRSSRRPPGP